MSMSDSHGPRSFEHVGMGGITLQGAHFKDFIGAVNESFAGIDYRDVIALCGQPFGDPASDLSGPAYDDPHAASKSSLLTKGLCVGSGRPLPVFNR